MLYFKKGSNFTILFSDRHYREQAIEALDKFRDTVIFDEGNVRSVSEAYKDQNTPPYLQLDIQDIRRRCKCFEYGVKVDANGEKWEAAEREQVIVDNNINDSKQVDINGATMQDLFPSDKDKVNSANFVSSMITESIKKYFVTQRLQQYVLDCCRTECEYSDATMRMTEYADLLHGTIGLCTENGELLDAVKKFVFYGKDLDVTNIEEEIGDIMWYIAIVCKSLKLDLQTILEKNISKLKKRYPEKFTEDKALNRDLNAERSALEN